MKHLNHKELEILNSKIGLKHLFRQKEFDTVKVLEMASYELELRELQAELVKVQDWVIKKRKRVVILFEGRDAAGKGGTINRITAHINPRQFRIVALPKPSEEEEGQWYFQRYVNHLPRAGEMIFFDRSWYNRAVVEPVNDFCSKKDYKIFMSQVNEFEKMIMESGIILIKIFLEINKEEQAKRLDAIKSSPLKNWQLSKVDAKAQELWDVYSKYEKKMFEETDTPLSPWHIIDANTRGGAILASLNLMLKKIPYKKS